MRTYTPKPAEVERRWHVIDASDVVLGRLASQVAILLRGKHKATFAPHVDTGDFVVIVNAEKVALTGSKAEQKKAYRHSGYPGGLRSRTYTEMLGRRLPEVLDRLASLGYGDVERVDAASERLTFALPPELRRDLRAAGRA